MNRSARDYSWLPDHQLQVALTLAHANDLIARAGDILFDYLKPGPLHLGNVEDEQLEHVTVLSVAPLPPAVSRYAADALTQLRAAIEHALYAEVELQLGRDLDDAEARRIEMPAATTAAAFNAWLSGSRRPELAPLRDGSVLAGRIRGLQPYHRQDAEEHPLRVLAAHTNFAKHRAPTVAATLVGAVIPDAYTLGQRKAAVNSQAPDERPVSAGDVLFSGPRSEVMLLDIWPKVSVRRPHTGAWCVLMNELGDLEEWVRMVAIPNLVAGTHDAAPLPPRLDLTTGIDDIREALALGDTLSARDRQTVRIQAASARPDLADMVLTHPSHPYPAHVAAWVESLDDDGVLHVFDRLAVPAQQGDLRGVVEVMGQLVAEIREKFPQPGDRA